MFCTNVRCSIENGCQEIAKDCDDKIDCTLDWCNEAGHECSHIAIHNRCDDGMFCSGEERCVLGIGCVPGSPPTCQDGIACTDDFCSDVSDSCQLVPVHTKCDDANFCNGVEYCSPTSGCTFGEIPCTACQACYPRSNECITVADADLDGICDSVDPCPEPPLSVQVCHNKKVICLTHEAAMAHLRQHSGDSIGPCE